MDICAPAVGGAARASRLLIHIASDCSSAAGSAVTFIRRLLAQRLQGPLRARVPLKLAIHDLQGRCTLALDDAGPLVDVTLPPGTYHVSTDHGGARRRYTVALEQGASFDLYLRGDRDGRH
jgi:hypothetical protein